MDPGPHQRIAAIKGREPSRSVSARYSGPVAKTIILLVTAWQLLAQKGATATDETFAFLQPSIVLTPQERQMVDSGQVLVRTLASSSREIAILALVAVSASGDSLVESVRQIAEFKRGPLVLAIGRFSNPPNVHDLDNLALDNSDLEGILRCRPGECDVKLSAGEMERLRRAGQSGGGRNIPGLQDAFRRLVLERVQAYVARGHPGIPNYEDQNQPVNLYATFSGIVRRSPSLTEHLPTVAEYLEQYPKARLSDVESFVYWSKELYGQKPVVTATHVIIIRNDPRGGLPVALVAGKQIFSTHYINGSLNLTMILQGLGGLHNYLGYVNRTEVDFLGGILSPVKRVFLERRLRSETRKIFAVLRTRLERHENSRR